MTLFEPIPSQSSMRDKRSLLACQLAVRKRTPDYVYLEIGSYHGGTIQPHLRDPLCGHIYSIDKRVERQPDARGSWFVNADNTAERMRSGLRAVSPDLDKLTCIDGDTRETAPEAIEARPSLCFIDGEHTDQAAIDDFEFCWRLLTKPTAVAPASGNESRPESPGGVIVFHDANVIYNALTEILGKLEGQTIPFHAFNLPDSLMVIDIGGYGLHTEAAIRSMLTDNYVGYLASMRANDHFRRFANRPVFRLLRRIRGWAR